MEEIFIRDDFIKLGQAIKLAGLVESGVEAKEVIQDGLVRVNWLNNFFMPYNHVYCIIFYMNSLIV